MTEEQASQLYATAPELVDEAVSAVEQAQVVRAFYKSDYSGFARGLKKARTTRGSHGTVLKAQAQQEIIDAAAVMLASVFEVDAAAAGNLPYPFEQARFLASTRVQAPTMTDEDADVDAVVPGYSPGYTEE